MSMIRVPKLYVVASKIAKAVKEEGASLKELVYSHKYRHFPVCVPPSSTSSLQSTVETVPAFPALFQMAELLEETITRTVLLYGNIKALYALVIETLSRESVLGELLERTRILENEQHLLWDPWLVRILVTELLWRKQRLPPGGKRIQTILHYEPGLREELASLEAAGVPVEKSAEGVRSAMERSGIERRGSGDLDNLDVPPPDDDIMQTVRVLAWFLLYSMGMFSLPFLAFVGVKHSFLHYFGIGGFANTVWSVVAAVVVVNVIIMAYACKGFYEPDDDRKEDDKKEK